VKVAPVEEQKVKEKPVKKRRKIYPIFSSSAQAYCR